MAINRQHFAETLGFLPQWHCPRCTSGTVKEVRKERVVLEPAYSQHEHSEDWWDPERMTQRFCARMVCTDASCGEIVFVTGQMIVSYGGYDDEHGGVEWIEELQPRAVYPAVPAFRMSGDWPKPVITELRHAFGHIWRDSGAAANRLRTAVECLLDHFKIKRAMMVMKGSTKKKVTLTLHDRILLFQKAKPEEGDLLLAVKWLGNAGSHADLLGISREAVLDGMMIMEHVLHLLFDKSGEEVTKLASKINKLKGPVAKKKKPKKLFGG